MNFKISKINKIFIVIITVFSISCFAFYPVSAGAPLSIVTNIVKVAVDFVVCTIGDNVLGINDCNGGGGSPAPTPPSPPPCVPAWTPATSEYCIGESFTQDDGCGSTRVIVGTKNCNKIPTATNLSVVSNNYCSNSNHYFSWTYSDPDNNNESRFQLQVDNNSNFSSPEINRNYPGLSNPSPTTNNQVVLVSVSSITDKLIYNTTYYWRVNVYDSNGAESGWVTGPSFTTEKHQYPLVNFDWLPSNPSQGEDVLFTDQSTVYGGSSKSAWSWIFTDGNPASSSQQNPTTQFNFTEDKQVTLQVTDSDNYSCSISKTVNVQSELPGWQEN